MRALLVIALAIGALYVFGGGGESRPPDRTRVLDRMQDRQQSARHILEPGQCVIHAAG